MAVIFVSPDSNNLASVSCIICSHSIRKDHATVGSNDASGLPAFACTDHMHDRASWIVNWSLFDSKQTESRFFGAPTSRA